MNDYGYMLCPHCGAQTTVDPALAYPDDPMEYCKECDEPLFGNENNVIMRDIRFRGKRIDNGEWVYGYYINERLRSFIRPIDNDAKLDMLEIIAESRGQFTEQKDSKNVDIYEGDVLKYTYPRDRSGEDIVEYIQSVEWEIWSGITGFAIHNDMNREVIGNIHDNPELLQP